MKALPVALVGCGALAEHYYAPALRALARDGRLEVAALVDPDAARCARLAPFFPGARSLDSLDGLGEVSLAIVASPARWHAEQTIMLLGRNIAVLCEKPMAVTSAEGEAMVAAARRSGLPLAVGHFRRFFPAFESIGHFLQQDTFGRLRQFAIQEGGPFHWPAATPSFFDPRQAGGGVLLDAGVHVLDVLDGGLGEPATLGYQDDAQGGLEANARLQLTYVPRADGHEPVRGTVLLSRDWKTSDTWTLEFERATVLWRTGQAARVEIRPAGAPHALVSQLTTDTPDGPRPADSYAQAFTRQILDVIEAVEQRRAPRVTGAAALGSLRLIERCYRERTPLVPSPA